jgi:hypothetical protein
MKMRAKILCSISSAVDLRKSEGSRKTDIGLREGSRYYGIPGDGNHFGGEKTRPSSISSLIMWKAFILISGF